MPGSSAGLPEPVFFNDPADSPRQDQRFGDRRDVAANGTPNTSSLTALGESASDFEAMRAKPIWRPLSIQNGDFSQDQSGDVVPG